MKKRKKAPFPRTRGEVFTNTPELYTNTYTTTRYNAATLTSTDMGAASMPGITGEIMTDVVTPGYRELSIAGKVIINPMTKRTGGLYIEPFSGTWATNVWIGGGTPPTGTTLLYTHHVNNYNASYLNPNFPSIQTGDIELIKTSAMNSALGKSHQRDVLGAVDLMESGKTYTMLATQLGRFTSMVKTAKRIKRGDINIGTLKGELAHMSKYKGLTTLATAKGAGDLWLEFQYGVIPLMLSIEGLVKALHSSKQESINPITGKPIRQTYRGKDTTADFISKDNKIAVTGSYGSQIWDTYTHSVDFNYEAKAGIITSYAPSLKARLGMEMRDLPSTAYELIPFSFVADWWLNLGKYIEAATPVSGFSSYGSWLTVITEEYHTYAYSRVGASGASKTYRSTYNSLSCSVSYWIREYHRTPGISARPPKFDSRFKSITHAVSAVALLLGRGTSHLSARL